MRKGQKKRVWTPAKKAEIVYKHMNGHISVRTLEKEYIVEGESSFIPKGHPGNHFAALHVFFSVYFPLTDALRILTNK